MGTKIDYRGSGIPIKLKGLLETRIMKNPKNRVYLQMIADYCQLMKTMKDKKYAIQINVDHREIAGRLIDKNDGDLIGFISIELEDY